MKRIGEPYLPDEIRRRIQPTPETDALTKMYANADPARARDAATDKCSRLERERDSAKTLNRSLLDQLEAKDAQIEALRTALQEITNGKGGAYNAANIARDALTAFPNA